MKILKNLAGFMPILVVLFIFAPALHGTPQDTDKILSDGEKLIQDNAPWRALSLFQKALENDEENPKLLTAAGKAAFLTNDISMSMDYLYAALDLVPENYTANLFLGKALRQQGQEMAADTMTQKDGFMMIEDSLKFFRKAIEVELKSAEPCLEQAYTLYALYDYQGADEAAVQALERDPKSTDA
ncbi:MAG: hypothetical protein ABIK28_05360, partial [Planctomycetota bacterium]